MKIRTLVLPFAAALFAVGCTTTTDEVTEEAVVSEAAEAGQSEATEDEDGEQGKGRPPGR
ncbi:MAG: hypothetical protein ACX94B_16100 [Henriciella sp.]